MLPQSRGTGYKRLSQDTGSQEPAYSREGEEDAARSSDGKGVKAKASRLGTSRAAPAGYTKLPEATVSGRAELPQAAVLGVASLPCFTGTPEVDPTEGATAFFSPRVEVDTAGAEGPDVRLRRSGSHGGTPKPRPPRLLELGESDDTQCEHEASASWEPPSAPDGAVDGWGPARASACESAARKANELAQQTFELAHGFALRSPLAMAAQGLKQQLETLALHAACGDAPAIVLAETLRRRPVLTPAGTPAGSKLAGQPPLLEREEQEQEQDKAACQASSAARDLPAVTPRTAVSGETASAIDGRALQALSGSASPAAAQALKAARSRLAVAATTAAACIAATTPENKNLASTREASTPPQAIGRGKLL